MKPSITISQLQIMREHGEQEYPDECCGFLFGRERGAEREILEVVPVLNQQGENRTRRFLISPEQYRSAEQHAREKQLDLLGFYHSHPDHPAIPSVFDRENALPFYSYVIISVRGGKSAEVRSWQLSLERDQYDEEVIIER